MDYIKWRDKSNINIITKHTNDTVEIHSKYNIIINKPEAVENYNIENLFFDRSYQMTSYLLPLKRSLKWCQK